MHHGRTPNAPTKTDYTALAEKLLGYSIQIDDSTLQLNHVIAVGAFGAIFLGVEYRQDKRTEKSYAVKCLLRNHYNPHADKFVWQETTNHSAVRHPNVVTLFRVVEHVDLVFIIMEYCPSGDLFKAIIDRQEFVGQDDKVRLAWLQIAEGVRACHAQGVYHRDIKPENILIRSPANPNLHLVLADFGLSTKDEWSFEFGVGSSYYMSPECFRKQRRGHKKQNSYSSRLADVWALGVVLINLSCGRNPWLRAHPDEPTYASFCQDDGYLNYILPITTDFSNLLKRVFRIDPSQRIALDEFIDEVGKMDHFTLNYQELMSASDAVRAAAGSLLRVRWEQEMMNTTQQASLENDGAAPEAVVGYLSFLSDRQESDRDGSYDDPMQFLKSSNSFQDGVTFANSVYSQASEGEEDAEEDEELDDDDHCEEDSDEEYEAEYETSHGADVDADGTDLALEVEIVDDEMSDTESIASTVCTARISPTPSSPSDEEYADQWDLFPSSPYIDLDETDIFPHPPPLTTAPSIPSTPNCGLATPARTDAYDDCGTFPPLEPISFADSALRSGLDCPDILDSGSSGTPTEGTHSIAHSTCTPKRRLYQTQCDSDIDKRHLRPQKVARGVLQRFAAEARCLSTHFSI